MFLIGFMLWTTSVFARAEIPRARAPGELRLALLGGGFATLRAPTGESLAQRLEFHLRQVLNRPVSVIDATRGQASALESLNEIPDLMDRERPDYVMYYAANASEVVDTAIAARAERPFLTADNWMFRALVSVIRPETEFESKLLHALNLTFAAFRFRTPHALLDPYAQVLASMRDKVERGGGRFKVFWPGSKINANSWREPELHGSTGKMFKLLIGLARPVQIKKTEMVSALLEQKIPLLVNMQISAFLHSVDNYQFRYVDKISLVVANAFAADLR